MTITERRVSECSASIAKEGDMTEYFDLSETIATDEKIISKQKERFKPVEQRYDWRLVFELSKVNNGPYYGNDLQVQNYHWPSDTWLRKRLRFVRQREAEEGGEK
jgi:hypothetical protein